MTACGSAVMDRYMREGYNHALLVSISTVAR